MQASWPVGSWQEALSKPTLFLDAVTRRDFKRRNRSRNSRRATPAIAPQFDSPVRTGICQTLIIANPWQKYRIVEDILKTSPGQKTLIFVDTPDTARYLAHLLCQNGQKATFIHRERGENPETKVIDCFDPPSCNILVATDHAAAGLKITGLQHVINYYEPMHEDCYLYRLSYIQHAEGKATTIVPKNWHLSHRIAKALRKHQPIDLASFVAAASACYGSERCRNLADDSSDDDDW